MLNKLDLVEEYVLNILNKYRLSCINNESKHHDCKDSNTCLIPCLIGLCGPQGSGKSTLVKDVANNFSNALVISIDDFYLKFQDQQLLAQGDNELLKTRGNAGTHDIPFLNEILNSVFKANLQDNDVELKVPKYDKSLHGGAGDRASIEDWDTINISRSNPISLILLEGWNVGHTSMDDLEMQELIRCSESNLSNVSSKTVEEEYLHNDLEIIMNSKENLSLESISLMFPSLRLLRNCSYDNICEINSNLKDYESLFKRLDGYILLLSDTLEWVYDWRYEQEVKNNGSKLSKSLVEKFVDRFMPGYAIGLPKLTTNNFKNCIFYRENNKYLVINLDFQRNATSFYRIN